MIKQLTLVGFALFFMTAQVSANELIQMKKEAVEVTKSFVGKLGSAMKQEMKKGGPTAAIKVCTEKAPQYAAEISKEKGWKVTRVGTRVRNPMLGMPDVWEQYVLKEFAVQAAKGESYEKMAFAEIVEEPNGRYFRFMKAIGTKPQCLTCHGDEQAVSSEVLAILSKHYPHDQARNYKVGELRGAVSIKRPL